MGRGGMGNDRRNPRKHHEAIFVLIHKAGSHPNSQS